jgi:hypothetical protein
VLAAEPDRVVDPDHPADPVAPGAAGVHDHTGRDRPLRGDDAGHAAVFSFDTRRLAALEHLEPFALGGADERAHGRDGVGVA